MRIADLPKIVEVLSVGEEPKFVVLTYRDFVRFATAVSAEHAPDVITVLDAAGEHEFVVIAYEGLRSALLRLDINGGIDERAYLERYTDVADAVARGALACGAEHYVLQGYFEQRMVRFANDDLPGAKTSR